MSQSIKQWAMDIVASLVVTTPIWLSCKYLGVGRTMEILIAILNAFSA